MMVVTIIRTALAGVEARRWSLTRIISLCGGIIDDHGQIVGLEAKPHVEVCVE